MLFLCSILYFCSLIDRFLYTILFVTYFNECLYLFNVHYNSSAFVVCYSMTVIFNVSLNRSCFHSYYLTHLYVLQFVSLDINKYLKANMYTIILKKLNSIWIYNKKVFTLIVNTKIEKKMKAGLKVLNHPSCEYWLLRIIKSLLNLEVR